MEKRYCFIVGALLLLLGSAPMHCAQAQKEDNEVSSEVKNQKNEAQEVYGYFIFKGKIETEEYNKILQEFKKKEAADTKSLDAMAEIYRKQFHYLKGEKREQAVASTCRSIKIFLVESRIIEIYAKIEALEKKRKGKWFEKWKSEVVKK